MYVLCAMRHVMRHVCAVDCYHHKWIKYSDACAPSGERTCDAIMFNSCTSKSHFVIKMTCIIDRYWFDFESIKDLQST